MDNNSNNMDNLNGNVGGVDNMAYSSDAMNSQPVDNAGVQPDMNAGNPKNATASMIWGLVTLCLNLIMVCSMSLGGPYLFGGLLCIGPVIGIVNSVSGWNTVNHGKAVVGRITSIIALVLGSITLIFGIIAKFSS